MPAPKEISRLVEQFERNADAYRSPGYLEAQVRIEFINPFFASLGWDIDNRQGFAEAYKDVIYEDAIKIGGATKAPDSCSRAAKTPDSMLAKSIFTGYTHRGSCQCRGLRLAYE
jgi:hypothetical protein